MSDIDPGLALIIADAISSDRLDVFTCLPGIVRSYDESTKTAEVELVTKRAVPTEDDGIVHEQIKPIPNVPVLELGGDDLSFTCKPAAGSAVLLLFAQWSFAQWRQNGAIGEPGDLRAHGPSYPIAIPWRRPGGKASADAAPSIGVPGGLRAKFGLSTVEIGAGSDFVALASKVTTELNKIAAAFASFVPGSGGASFGAPYIPANVGPVAATKLKTD